MTCPVCFFREDHQKSLKISTFGIDRFEDKLTKYKNNFIDGIRQMDSLSKCMCYSEFNNDTMVSWTDEFLTALKGAENEVINAFNSIHSIYEDSISKSSKIATDNLWSYLTKQNLLAQTQGITSYTKLLFRARERNDFDERDTKQYFHIPFSKRHLVRNQRFSVSGQPMLYFSSSILAVTKELENDINKLAIAAFLPNYSKYFHSKIFSLTNHIGESIENSLPGFSSSDIKISYNDNHLAPNRNTITNDIHRTVLMHICTFPAERKGSYTPEYAVPQMLTTALLENDFNGLVFPSTKSYSNLNGFHRFSSYHMNVALFVPYDKSNDTNMELLNSFSIYTLDGSEKLNLRIIDIMNRADEIIEINKKSNINNNNYVIPIVNMKLYLEYMSESNVSSVGYFETDFGKLELEFYMKMLNQLEKFIN